MSENTYCPYCGTPTTTASQCVKCGRTVNQLYRGTTTIQDNVTMAPSMSLQDELEYLLALRERQLAHLKAIRHRDHVQWQPCLHDQCQECCGTGIKRDGSMCVHNLSCPCPKCTPRCSVGGSR